MAQLVALPKIAPLKGVNMDQHEMKYVNVDIQSCPFQFYNVFRKEAYRLPHMSPNYVKSITVTKGDWFAVGSEKVVVYYPEGKDVSSRTEWFKDSLIRANDSEKIITFQVLEGQIMENYKRFFAELVVLDELNLAQWIVVFDKKCHCSPEPDKYLNLLEKVSKDVDHFLSRN